MGEFLYDQIAYQRRVGFDAWELPHGLTDEAFQRALCELTEVYQPSADGRLPRSAPGQRPDSRIPECQMNGGNFIFSALYSAASTPAPP